MMNRLRRGMSAENVKAGIRIRRYKREMVRFRIQGNIKRIGTAYSGFRMSRFQVFKIFRRNENESSKRHKKSLRKYASGNK